MSNLDKLETLISRWDSAVSQAETALERLVEIQDDIASWANKADDDTDTLSRLKAQVEDLADLRVDAALQTVRESNHNEVARYLEDALDEEAQKEDDED
jgi:hypothetical protein